MALLIEKNLTVLGLDLSQVYVRFQIQYDVEGNLVYAFSKSFPSQSAYAEDPKSRGLKVDGIRDIYALNYDRSTDGSDLLTAIHNKIKTELSTDVYEESPVFDPSTGDPILDPSTGDPVTEEVLATPKFAMDSSISIVDID